MQKSMLIALARLALMVVLVMAVQGMAVDDAYGIGPCIDVCPDYAPNCGNTYCWCEDRYQWNAPGRHAGPGVTTCTNCWDTGCSCYPL